MSGFNFLFSIIAIFVLIFFVIAIVGGIVLWHKNNNSPRLKVSAVVSAKRVDETFQQQPVMGDITGAHGYNTIIYEDYFITFQVESGDKLEFLIKESEYRRLMEGDYGNLFFQGTRYLGFEKI